MKKEKLILLLTAAASVVLAFVPGVGNDIFGLLALPFTATGWLLRFLSLSGPVGNTASLVLYGLVCLVPAAFWLRSRRRTEDWLLVLLTPVLAVVLYYMVNPNLRHSLMQNEVGDAIIASAVWSTLATWGVLKLLYAGCWERERHIYRVLRIFLLLCAAGSLVSCFGTGTANLLFQLKANRNAWSGYQSGLTDLFLVLTYLLVAVEKGLSALVLYRGAGLLEELERDPFSEGCLAAADSVSRTGRNALAIISLSGLLLNLSQLLLTPMLMHISVSVTFPIEGMAVCFGMLAVTKLLVKGKQLKDDNDLFV